VVFYVFFLPVGVRTNRNARIRIPIAIPTVYLSLLIKQLPLMIERFGWWRHQPIGQGLVFLPVGVLTNRNARIRIPIAIPTGYFNLLIRLPL